MLPSEKSHSSIGSEGSKQRSNEFWVSELAPTGKVFARLQAPSFEKATSDSVNYRLIPDSLPFGEFSVDPMDGELSVQKPLDVETRGEYRFYAQAYTTGNRPRWSEPFEVRVRLIDADDNPPKFVDSPAAESNNSVFKLPLGLHPGSFITRFKYTDVDKVNYYLLNSVNY